MSSGKAVERQIWLWDFGSQADQRLIHQLYMDETALAVLVFDGQKEDLFETLGQWDRDLTSAARKEFAKLLVAGRVDASAAQVPGLLGNEPEEESGLRGTQAGHPGRHQLGRDSLTQQACRQSLKYSEREYHRTAGAWVEKVACWIRMLSA